MNPISISNRNIYSIYLMNIGGDKVEIVLHNMRHALSVMSKRTVDIYKSQTIIAYNATKNITGNAFIGLADGGTQKYFVIT